MFYEAFEEEAAELRRALDASPIASEVDASFTWKTTQEHHGGAFGERAPSDVISVRTQSVLPPAWADGLRGIVTRSTGFDHVLAYRHESGVEVPAGSLPLYCNRAVAEQALMMWMMLLRKATQQQRQFRTFHRDGITGFEAEAKTLLVVGVGNIGSEIVKIGQGLAMRVIGHDLEQKWDFVEYADDVDTAIAEADIIACAMNLTDENRGYFSKQRLERAKPSALFVNVSRGELSPTTVLLDLLESGALAGVGLDVFDEERTLAGALRDGADPPEGEAGEQVRAALALAERDDAIVTPHNAFNTAEAVLRKAEHSVQQLESLLRTGEMKWSV
jgi:D-lactate dehydrogenase